VGVEQILATVVPVLLVVAVGWLLGERLALDLRTLTELVLHLGGPALVFVSLLRGDVAGAEIVVLAVGAAVIVLGVGVVVRVGASVAGRQPGALYLPAMFFNAGNMLLPLALLAFGEAGLSRAVVVFATMCFLQSSLGVALASGRFDLGRMLRLPYFHAVVAAGLVRAGGFEVPAMLLRPLEMLGSLAVPLMLLALGLRLRSVRSPDWRAPLWVTAARIGGGYLVARLFVGAVGLEGTGRSVLLLASVMPAAVINFVFAEKYGEESSDVAAAVMVSTLVSFATTPLVLAFGL
jgi:predicted permease